MWPEALDRVIDDVAREMTVGAPRGDVRAHVLARIDHDGFARLKASPWMLSLTAAAVVLVAIVTYRALGRLKPDPTDALRGSDVVLAAETPSSAVQTFGAANAAGSKAAHASPRVPISPSPIDDLSPAPIDVRPLVVDTLAFPSIDVPPLNTIAPIAVAPLGEGDRP